MEGEMSSVVRFKPFFEAGLDAAFDDLVRRTLAEPGSANWVPAADIVQVGEDVVITLEVPGITAEDIEIEVKDRSLVVRGRRQFPATAEDEAEPKLVRSEIRRGEFSRGFRLPAHVGPDAVNASYDAGMLTIKVSGAQPAPVTRRVPIENLTPAAPAVDEGDAQA
jgi:HSP20 family molecular chaperone IbpA